MILTLTETSSIGRSKVTSKENSHIWWDPKDSSWAWNNQPIRQEWQNPSRPEFERPHVQVMECCRACPRNAWRQCQSTQGFLQASIRVHLAEPLQEELPSIYFSADNCQPLRRKRRRIPLPDGRVSNVECSRPGHVDLAKVVKIAGIRPNQILSLKETEAVSGDLHDRAVNSHFLLNLNYFSFGPNQIKRCWRSLEESERQSEVQAHEQVYSNQ